MKKFFIFLLLPLFLHCRKEPVNKSTAQEKICFLTKEEHRSFGSTVYERDLYGKLVKMTKYSGDKVWDISVYTYEGNNLQLIKSYYPFQYSSNVIKEEYLARIIRFYRQGNKVIRTLYYVTDGMPLPHDSSIYEIAPNDIYVRRDSYLFEKDSGTYRHLQYTIYDYQGDTLLTKRVYRVNGNILVPTDIYDLDDKKNHMLNYSPFPLEVKHNIVRERAIENSFYEDFKFTYTYNSEGYPLTSARNGTSPVKYTYDCY